MDKPQSAASALALARRLGRDLVSGLASAEEFEQGALRMCGQGYSGAGRDMACEIAWGLAQGALDRLGPAGLELLAGEDGPEECPQRLEAAALEGLDWFSWGACALPGQGALAFGLAKFAKLGSLALRGMAMETGQGEAPMLSAKKLAWRFSRLCSMDQEQRRRFGPQQRAELIHALSGELASSQNGRLERAKAGEGMPGKAFDRILDRDNAQNDLLAEMIADAEILELARGGRGYAELGRGKAVYLCDHPGLLARFPDGAHDGQIALAPARLFEELLGKTMALNRARDRLAGIWLAMDLDLAYGASSWKELPAMPSAVPGAALCGDLPTRLMFAPNGEIGQALRQQGMESAAGRLWDRAWSAGAAEGQPDSAGAREMAIARLSAAPRFAAGWEPAAQAMAESGALAAIAKASSGSKAAFDAFSKLAQEATAALRKGDPELAGPGLGGKMPKNGQGNAAGPVRKLRRQDAGG